MEQNRNRFTVHYYDHNKDIGHVVRGVVAILPSKKGMILKLENGSEYLIKNREFFSPKCLSRKTYEMTGVTISYENHWRYLDSDEYVEVVNGELKSETDEDEEMDCES